jgi:uncharacterized protein DUF4129
LKAQRSIAVVAFLFTGWIVASLALSGDVFQATAPLNSQQFIDVFFASAGDIVLTFISLFLFVFLFWIVKDRKLLVERLKALFSRRKGARATKKSRDITRNILGILTLLAVVILLRNLGLVQLPQQTQVGASLRGVVGLQFPGFGGQNFQSSLLVIYHFFAVWAVEIALLAIIGFCILIFGQAAAQMRASNPAWSSGAPVIVEETINVLQDGVQELMGGADARASILECYRRLCSIFDSRLDKAHHPLTARELQEIMIRQLKLSARSLNRLTELFEEARYSQHSITIGMKEDAISALREIEDSLRHPSENTLEAIQ